MKLTVARSKEGIVIVTLVKKFTLEEVLYFEDEMKKITSQSLSIIAFDLSRLDFIDSSAIGSLIKIKNQITAKGVVLVLLDVPQVVMSAFQVAYLERFFMIKKSEDFYRMYPAAPRCDDTV